MMVKFSLIICTYKRAVPLANLLNSIINQIVCPFEILIIDGSPDNETKVLVDKLSLKNLKYYIVYRFNVFHKKRQMKEFIFIFDASNFRSVF